MKKVYLVTVPSKENPSTPYRFVTNDVSSLSSVYLYFVVESIDFKNIDA